MNGKEGPDMSENTLESRQCDADIHTYASKEGTGEGGRMDNPTGKK